MQLELNGPKFERELRKKLKAETASHRQTQSAPPGFPLEVDRIKKALCQCKPGQVDVLESYFGLFGAPRKDVNTIAKEAAVSEAEVIERLNEGLRALREPGSKKS